MAQQNFRKEINTLQLTMFSIGAIVGSGLFVLTGLGIAVVGNIAPYIYLAAAVFTIINAVPTMVAGTALPTSGGYYKYISRLYSPSLGFYFMWTRVLGLVSVGTMTLAFSTYVAILVPSANKTLVAIGLLTVLTILNLFKVDIMASANKYVVYILLVAMALFVVSGIPHMDISQMQEATETTLSSVFLCLVYYMNALDGAKLVVNMGAECKTPRKSIPIAIVAGIIISGLFYAVITLIAITAADYQSLAGAALGSYAEAFMSPTTFYFFIAGGALLGILSTVNANMVVMPRILFAGAKDGLLPRYFGELNKHGVPARALIFMYIVVSGAVLSGADIATLVAFTSAPGVLMNIAFTLSVLKVPKLFPHIYKNNFSYMSVPALTVITIISIAITFRLSLSAFQALDAGVVMGIFVYYGLGTIYMFVMKYRAKKAGTKFNDYKGQYDAEWVEEENRLKNLAESQQAS